MRERAGFVCEYCRLPLARVRVRFEVEHVIPRQHGGTDAPGNLALACFRCNRHKGPNLTGLDRAARRPKLARLFNPREHTWDYHFTFDSPLVVGRTPTGRVTVNLLNMNHPEAVALRAALIAEGVFPPAG